MEPDLIEAYLIELRDGMSGRADLDDVLAEVEDHLRLKASRLEAGGLDQLDAQRRALEVFGDPAVVARAFASALDVPGAVPTRFTKFSGLVAIAAGLAWINLIVFGVFALGMMMVSESTVRPFAIGAVALTVIAFVGFVQWWRSACAHWSRPTRSSSGWRRDTRRSVLDWAGSARATASHATSCTTVRFADTNILLYAISTDPREEQKAAIAMSVLDGRDVVLSEDLSHTVDHGGIRVVNQFA